MMRVPEEWQGKPRACPFISFPLEAAVAPAPRRGRLDRVVRHGRRLELGKRTGDEAQVRSRLPSVEELSKPGAAMKALRGIRRRIAQLDAEYRRELYTEFMKLRDVAAILQANFDMWTEFCRDPVWRKADPRYRPKLSAPDEALRFATIELCAKVKKRKRRNRRVNVYFSALRELNARNVPIIDTVATMFEAQGVRGLSRDWAERQRAERAAADLGDEREVSVRTNESHPDEADHGKSGREKTIKAPAKRERSSGLGELADTSGIPKPDLIDAFLEPSKALRRLLNGGAGSKGDFTLILTETVRGKPVFRLRKLE